MRRKSTEITAGNIFGTLANNNTTIGGGAADATTINAAIVGLNGDLDTNGTGNVIIDDGAKIVTTGNTYMAGNNINLNGGSIKAAGVGALDIERGGVDFLLRGSDIGALSQELRGHLSDR